MLSRSGAGAVTRVAGGKSGEGTGRSKAKSRTEQAGGVRAAWCGRQSGVAILLHR